MSDNNGKNNETKAEQPMKHAEPRHTGLLFDILPLPEPRSHGRIGNTYVDSEADIVSLPVRQRPLKPGWITTQMVPRPGSLSARSGRFRHQALLAALPPAPTLGHIQHPGHLLRPPDRFRAKVHVQPGAPTNWHICHVIST